ncbi:hypothetical protein PIB30_042120 [Stylosanthes scabra]|uniref:Transposase MuDR plant domain-containing protein n=1 Tax=Stylosanthes scabra TaxID=79078 RepID=A0ABU6VEI4_9FABA|nr:hypothetical protein [Stylosanthes scabra]
MSGSNLIVGTLYPDGEMIQQADGIGFVCPNPILCYIERVDTLDELKIFILRTMGAFGRKNVRRIAYRLLNILPPLEYKPGRPIAAAPLRIATPDVSMEMDSGSGEGSDGEYLGETDESSDSFDEVEFVDETQVGRRFLLPAPAAVPDLASVSSHFHTLSLYAMEEEPREGHDGGEDDYINLDGGEEFRVGHRFSCREAVQMAVKNYNIRRAAEYRVLESNPYKYVCRCKKHESGCP